MLSETLLSKLGRRGMTGRVCRSRKMSGHVKRVYNSPLMSVKDAYQKTRVREVMTAVGAYSCKKWWPDKFDGRKIG